MAIDPNNNHPWYPQYPPHLRFPGLDIDKGPVYRAGAILLGGWVVVVVLCPVAALLFQATWPLWPLTRWLPWAVFALILAAILLFQFVWDRRRNGVRPRRFGIQKIEASRQGDGPSTRSVVWDPYDRIPPLMKHWYAIWLYDIGDGLVEILLKGIRAGRATMVEEPPFFDAPQWPPIPPNMGPQGGPGPGGGNGGLFRGGFGGGFGQHPGRGQGQLGPGGQGQLGPGADTPKGPTPF